MNDCVAVDVGNTRVKWGLGRAGSVVAVAALPDAAAAWHEQACAWGLSADTPWIVSGVQPERCARLIAWLAGRGASVRRLESYRDLPLTVALEHPERAGIDRLLDAVAANHRRPPDAPAIIVDAGSAVTVDYVDAAGVFRGGAIFPGLRLMAQALHSYTALLPLIEITRPEPAPGASTTQALQTGVYHAVVGGIERLIDELAAQAQAAPVIYLTGGDAALLAERVRRPITLWLEMTLAGILYSGA